MGRWQQHEFLMTEVWRVSEYFASGFVFQAGSEEQTAKAITAHNADCDAYEARIAELEEEVEYMDRKRFENRAFAILYRKRGLAAQKRIAELEQQFNAACRETQDVFSGMVVMADKLARIAALVKPVPVTDLVETGISEHQMLHERQAAIRAILEEES